MDTGRSFEASFAGFDKLSLLEMVKLQAQVLVPVLRAFRKEFGAERANEIAFGALREWSRDIYRHIGEQGEGTPAEKFDSIMTAITPKIGNDVDFDVLQQTPEHFDFNITGCRYADFFRQLGEPELGTILLCEVDNHMADLIGAPDVKLDRTQTIMNGAKYCDFRWTMKRAEAK